MDMSRFVHATLKGALSGPRALQLRTKRCGDLVVSKVGDFRIRVSIHAPCDSSNLAKSIVSVSIHAPLRGDRLGPAQSPLFAVSIHACGRDDQSWIIKPWDWSIARSDSCASVSSFLIHAPCGRPVLGLPDSKSGFQSTRPAIPEVQKFPLLDPRALARPRDSGTH